MTCDRTKVRVHAVEGLPPEESEWLTASDLKIAIDVLEELLCRYGIYRRIRVP